jgi:2-succinyl-5-enolpyruvyl-6-hydroxy-3-cyclohexene-1-carboxylate synthase
LFADAQNFNELVQLNKSKIAILVGQNPPSPLITTVLTELQHLVPVFTDICSSQIQIGLKNWDWGMLKRDIPSSLEPDVLISLGTATISKPLKHFLKKSKPKHVHIGIWDDVGDPFETNPEHWKVNEADFLQTIFEILTSSLGNYSNAYLKDWENFLSNQTLTAPSLPQPFGKELQFMQKLFQQANENCIIQRYTCKFARFGSIFCTSRNHKT